MTTVLVIGATGQVGRLVVEEALGRGLSVRAQSRDAGRARGVLPAGAEVVQASPASAADLRPLVEGVDAVVLTHGGDVDGRGGVSFYETVLAVLEALEAGTHVSLMTAMNTSRSAGRSRYGFVAQTARTDLTDLARRGYLDASRQGRRVVWHPVGDLPARLGA